MAHAANLLTLLGVLIALPVGFMVGYWWRGRRKRTVI